MTEQEMAMFPEKAQAAAKALEILKELNAKSATFVASLPADIWGETPAAKPAKPTVTYIGTITTFGRRYSAKVLANNGREGIAVCNRESEGEAIATTEQKYPGVVWVLSNRFQQEVACL